MILIRKKLNMALPPSIIALFLALAPMAARADASCDALFGGLRAKLQENAQNYVLAMWTTNYFVPERDDRFMSKTELTMRFQNGDLFGAQKRDRIGFSRNDVARSSSDDASVRIRVDGKMMFNDQYGPYDPKCSREKFAIVDCGDCIEAFSFRVGNEVARNLSAGDQMAFLQPTPAPQSPAPSAVPEGTRQWNVANADTVNGNENYGLFNLRRRVLNLQDQLGYKPQDMSWGAPVAYSTLTWTGASGGYFVFVRRNPDDHREVSEDEVFAIYNTKAKKYLDATPADWSKTPAYEWKIVGRNGANFALFNVSVQDYLIVSETSWRTHDGLTYFNCSQNHDARVCAGKYPQ